MNGRVRMAVLFLFGLLLEAPGWAAINGPMGEPCTVRFVKRENNMEAYEITCDGRYTSTPADQTGCAIGMPNLSFYRFWKVGDVWLEFDGQRITGPPSWPPAPGTLIAIHEGCANPPNYMITCVSSCGSPPANCGPSDPSCVMNVRVLGGPGRWIWIPCDGQVHHVLLRMQQCRPVDTYAWQCFTTTERDYPLSCKPPVSCVTTGDHRGDGCCDPARNADPARGNNLNPDCTALFDRPGDRRNCCRPAGMLPPGGDPTHPRDGHPPLPGAWPLPGWCDVCGGGEGGGGGCTSDADCGGGLHCCSGTCRAEPCLPPPPSGFNAVIEVYGSEGHRWDARFKQGKVRVPMSFRLWDPAAGRYVWERAGQDGPDAPPQRPCKNRAGKVLDPNLACWSRPWLVPDFDENPTGIVRTHRLRLEGPRTVYVQPECGVEFNAVLNPAKLVAAFPGPVVTFDPARGLRVDMNNSDKCPVRQNVCADGRPCGVCPNGRPPDLDGTCPGGGTPSGTACPADGSTCEAACVYTIDLTFMYERRQTPSWCYEDSERDTACAVPGDLSSCVSQPNDPNPAVRPSGAVDDWRVSSPFCWEQTKPKPNRDIGQPASFKDPPNCTIDADRKCIDPAYLNTRCP